MGIWFEKLMMTTMYTIKLITNFMEHIVPPDNQHVEIGALVTGIVLQQNKASFPPYLPIRT